jgi:hypothetical protein
MSRRRDDPPFAAYLRLSIASDDSVSIAGQKGLVAEEARRRGSG